MVVAIGSAVRSLGGWRRRALACAAGAVGALALAPLDLTPALAVPMIVAVWLLDGSYARDVALDVALGEARGLWPGWRALRAAFGTGWWIGFGYFVAGFWWLSAAFLIDPDFTWELPFGVLGLPAVLALFFGAGFALARLLWSQGPARVFALAFALGAAEWCRGHLFTGFPWNPIGMGLGGTLVTAQLAALVGLDGLTLVTILLFAAPATLADPPGPRRYAPSLLAGLALAAILAFGAVRLARNPPVLIAGATVRIMQPGLRPDESFSYENREAIVSRYIALSQIDDAAKGIRLADVKLLVWPESAFPFILLREPDQLARIGAMLPAGTTLVTGAAREVDHPAADGQRAYSSYFNAMVAIDSGGRLLQSYDKVHLVPFGEYLPFSDLLRRLGLRNFVAIPGGFEPGSQRVAMRLPGLPAASPLICYEAIFPAEVRPGSGERPGFLLNITNDGWFGLTTGPEQHAAQARLRAIEEGLPLVRAAATGVSAIVDPVGRQLEVLPLGAEGILDGKIPQAIEPPLFTAAGSWSTLLLQVLNMMFLMAPRLRRPANLPCQRP